MGKQFDKMTDLLDSGVRNIVHAFYDQYVEVNTKFRAKAGFKMIIIREELGDCCDWCADLAGIYNYGEEPKEVFGRHLYCKCSVVCKTGKTYQDAWSKNEFHKYKDARIAREKEIITDYKYSMDRRIAKSKGRNHYDATNEWKDRKVNNSIKTKKAEEKYWKQYIKTEFKTSPTEERIGKLISDTFGGTVRFLPEVKQPQGVKMADYLYRNERWDLKSPEGDSKDSVYNAIHKKRGQARNFVISLEKAKYGYEEALMQSEKLFYRKGTRFVEKIMIVDKGEIKKVIERI